MYTHKTRTGVLLYFQIELLYLHKLFQSCISFVLYYDFNAYLNLEYIWIFMNIKTIDYALVDLQSIYFSLNIFSLLNRLYIYYWVKSAKGCL